MSDLESGHRTTRSSREDPRVVAAVLVPCLIIGVVLLFDWWPLLRGGFGWQWPYSAPQPELLANYLPFAFGLAVYLFGLRLVYGLAPWSYIAWCVFGTVFLSVAALMAEGDPRYVLLNRTISGVTTGGFSVAIRTERLCAALPNWPELMPTFTTFSSHMAISPPGWPLTYSLFAELLDKMPVLGGPLAAILRPLQCNDIPLMGLSDGQIASAWVGVASPLWAALTVIPLYDLARVLGGTKLARRASGCWPLIPSLIMFLGTLSTPYPLGTVIVFWLFWRGLDRTDGGRLAPELVAAGALAGLGLIYSFAFLPFLLFLGLFTLLRGQDFAERPIRIRLHAPVITGLQFGLGQVMIWILYLAVTGHSLLAVFESAMAFHLQLDRSYWPWLVLHLWDYALFLGLVPFLLALIGTVRYTKGPVRHTAVAVSLTLLIMVLSGTGRGETGRIWLFFAPFSLLAAVDVAGALTPAHRRLLLLGQVCWLFLLFLVLRTVDGCYTPPPSLAAVRQSTATEPAIPTAIEFGDRLQLEGFSGWVQKDPAQLTLDLHWRPNQPIVTPYFFSLVVVSPDGAPLASYTWQPFDFQFPTTCWYEAAKQGPIVDQVTIPLPAAEAAGDYWLSLRMFSLEKDQEPQYVPLSIPGVGRDDQVGLGPVHVIDRAAE